MAVQDNTGPNSIKITSRQIQDGATVGHMNDRRSFVFFSDAGQDLFKPGQLKICVGFVLFIRC